MLAFQRKVGVPPLGSWLKLGSVLPKLLRLVASVLVRGPVPVAVQRRSESDWKEPLMVPISNGLVRVGINVFAIDTNEVPPTDIFIVVAVQLKITVRISPAEKESTAEVA